MPDLQYYFNNLSYLPNDIERKLASEIVLFYKKFNSFNLSDFIIYLEDKKELINLVVDISDLKYTEDELDVKATIKTEGNTQVAEISTNINGNIYRAVSEQKDLYASIDKDIDIVEGQIRKMKTKKEKQMTSESIKDYEMISFNDESHQVEKEVLKTQYYEVRPMSVEDAKLKLQDSKNMFLTFVNADTEEVNVIFKLKDGVNFGLVEPE